LRLAAIVRRRVVTVFGAIDGVTMADGFPVRFDRNALSVSLIGDEFALVVLDAGPGEKNLVVFGPSGDELARLGTTCGTGTIYEVLDVSGEVRVIESTRYGLYQARLDPDSLTLERIAEWR
jgi:hypothetical protein